MKQSHKKNVFQMILTTVTVILIIAVAVLLIANKEQKVSAEPELPAEVVRGTSYIREQEAVPVAEIEESISAEEGSVQDAALLENLLADPALIFETLKNTNTVLVGESRTSGFSAYGFLDENHVLGGIGWSIQEIPALYDQIASLSPSHLVLSFGINELGRYPDTPVYYYAPEIYTGDLDKYIQDIRELVPGIKIYINCIVPCTDAVYQEFPGYAVIPEWNEHIKAFCEEKGYGYIDISDLCAAHADMYREDGTHLISDFYPYWGARIVEQIFSHE